MKIETARPIDLIPSEAETLGQLIDLIHDHVNDYELASREIKTLNEAEEILFRLYTFGKA